MELNFTVFRFMVYGLESVIRKTFLLYRCSFMFLSGIFIVFFFIKILIRSE